MKSLVQDVDEEAVVMMMRMMMKRRKVSMHQCSSNQHAQDSVCMLACVS